MKFKTINKEDLETMPFDDIAYIILKEKYYDITNEDDYLLCTLWVINNIHAETVDDFIENCLKKNKSKKAF